MLSTAGTPAFGALLIQTAVSGGSPRPPSSTARGGGRPTGLGQSSLPRLRAVDQLRRADGAVVRRRGVGGEPARASRRRSTSTPQAEGSGRGQAGSVSDGTAPAHRVGVAESEDGAVEAQQELAVRSTWRRWRRPARRLDRRHERWAARTRGGRRAAGVPLAEAEAAVRIDRAAVGPQLEVEVGDGQLRCCRCRPCRRRPARPSLWEPRRCRAPAATWRIGAVVGAGRVAGSSGSPALLVLDDEPQPAVGWSSTRWETTSAAATSGCRRRPMMSLPMRRRGQPSPPSARAPSRRSR